jgi:hypothetical protein
MHQRRLHLRRHSTRCPISQSLLILINRILRPSCLLPRRLLTACLCLPNRHSTRTLMLTVQRQDQGQQLQILRQSTSQQSTPHLMQVNFFVSCFMLNISKRLHTHTQISQPLTIILPLLSFCFYSLSPHLSHVSHTHSDSIYLPISLSPLSFPLSLYACMYMTNILTRLYIFRLTRYTRSSTSSGGNRHEHRCGRSRCSRAHS